MYTVHQSFFGTFTKSSKILYRSIGVEPAPKSIIAVCPQKTHAENRDAGKTLKTKLSKNSMFSSANHEFRKATNECDTSVYMYLLWKHKK